MNAAGIKKILYAETSKVTADLTPALAKALITDAANKEVKNVHGDTWSLEEAEPSITSYKNQLTGKNYRSENEPGEINPSFTIGEYDYEQKADLLGGTTVAKGGSGDDKNDIVGWKRSSSKVEITKCVMCETDDNIWFIFPKCKVVARESNTDKAIGLAVKGIVLEPTVEGIASEYNFDAAALV